MTDYRVLYYPNFVPDALWLRRVLLLTDGVYRIVPDDISPDDSEDILRLQDAIPSCLESLAPTTNDVSVAYGEEPRLTQFFEALASDRRKRSRELTVEMSSGGRVSIPGHVFVHDAKLSDFVVGQLTRNGLLIEDLGRGLAGDRFVVIQEDASELILSGVATRMARRLGIDTITDKQLPFALNALRTVPLSTADAEGALLSAIARASLPGAVANLTVEDYVDLRDTYSGIREAFKVLTVELAAVNRLTKLDDAVRLLERVEGVANDFHREFLDFQKSKYARAFRSWTPFVVGAALAIPASLVSPEAGVVMAAGGVAIQAIEKCARAEVQGPEKVFNMLSDLREDLIERSRVAHLA